ncbi:MAG: YncE family protein [Prevotellaceae bacterium]|nr:YncE family protein [Prevotellaceae bacterium]
MKKISNYISAIVMSVVVISCMDYGAKDEFDFNYSDSDGLFIVNEGNFMYGNASLSYYDINKKNVETEVFVRSNGIKLGDVAQSMTIHNGKGYIVVNNSGVIFTVDINTFKIIDIITGFTSPRYMHFINDDKAYVTDLYSSTIYILNPKTGKISGSIPVTGHKTTEQMVQSGKYVFTNCWSFDNKILVIDSETDKIVDSITVGIQPNSIAIDKNNKLWVLTDGGYQGNPYGHEIPSLFCINTSGFQIEKKFDFALNDSPAKLCINSSLDTLYFINQSIWKIGINATELPDTPIIPYKGTMYYGLAVSPETSEIYLADAIDYVQNGKVYRYTAQYVCIDTIDAGVCPSNFCFKFK